MSETTELKELKQEVLRMIDQLYEVLIRIRELSIDRYY